MPLVHLLGSILQLLSGFTLTYASITGDSFWSSVEEVKELVESRNGTEAIAAHMMLKSLVTLLSLSIASLSAIAGFLHAVYSLAPAVERNGDGSTANDAIIDEVNLLTPLLAASSLPSYPTGPSVSPATF